MSIMKLGTTVTISDCSSDCAGYQYYSLVYNTTVSGVTTTTEFMYADEGKFKDSSSFISKLKFVVWSFQVVNLHTLLVRTIQRNSQEVTVILWS